MRKVASVESDMSSMAYRIRGRTLAPSSAASSRNLSPAQPMRSPRQRRVSAEAIPAVAAAYLHMEPQQLGHLGLASELQVQSALHVPALQANACFATARALEAVPVSSAPPVLLADLHSSMEPAQPQPDDLGLASCLATPVEGVNSPAESSARQAGAVRAAGMLRSVSAQHLSGVHETANILDRYGDWVRRIRRRRRLDNIQALWNAIAKPAATATGTPRSTLDGITGATNTTPAGSVFALPDSQAVAGLGLGLGAGYSPTKAAPGVSAAAVGGAMGMGMGVGMGLSRLEEQASMEAEDVLLVQAAVDRSVSPQRRLRRLSSHN